jgi:hypothetical protein
VGSLQNILHSPTKVRISHMSIEAAAAAQDRLSEGVRDA